MTTLASFVLPDRPDFFEYGVSGAGSEPVNFLSCDPGVACALPVTRADLLGNVNAYFDYGKGGQPLAPWIGGPLVGNPIEFVGVRTSGAYRIDINGTVPEPSSIWLFIAMFVVSLAALRLTRRFRE